MADIAAFPTITDGIMHNAGPVWSFLTDSAVVAGQLVGFASSGVTRTVGAVSVEDCNVAATASIRTPVGVALFNAASGEELAVALPGSIVTMVCADNTTGIDAGDSVKTNDNTIGGTITKCAGVAGTPTRNDYWVVGIAFEDITASSAGGSGKVLLTGPTYYGWTSIA